MASRTVNPSKPCKTVSDYLNEVRRLREDWSNRRVDSKGEGRQLWFRGQRSSKWDLRPLLYRDEYVDAIESEIRLEFEGHSLGLAATTLSRNKWETYFLMQHYGAPTSLLDWTGSPLAGLYFSIVSEDEKLKNHDAAVWVLDPWRWNDLHFRGLYGPGLPGWKETEPYLQNLEDACNEEKISKRWPIALDPPSIDRRLSSQSARFLLFGKIRDLISAANKTDEERSGKSRLAQIIISSKSLENIRCELDDLGINQRVLFPDLQGLGEHLSWEWKNFRKKKRLY